MTGFEPATSCTQNKRATKLRYIPLAFPYKELYLSLERLTSLQLL